MIFNINSTRGHTGSLLVLHTLTVGNLKIVRSERSYYCYIHNPTFRIVLLLRNLSLDGKLCLRDDKSLFVFLERHTICFAKKLAE